MCEDEVSYLLLYHLHSTEIRPPPENGDAHIQQLPTLPSQKQQPNEKPLQAAPSGSPDLIAKMTPPFKKRQWSDPPGKYGFLVYL